MDARVNTKNVILTDVDIKDALVVNFEKNKLAMFPPSYMKFSVSAFKVLDIIAIHEYFVQLLEVDNRNWICFYSFQEREKYIKKNGKIIVKKISSFKCEKCYRIPTYIKLI